MTFGKQRAVYVFNINHISPLKNESGGVAFKFQNKK